MQFRPVTVCPPRYFRVEPLPIFSFPLGSEDVSSPFLLPCSKKILLTTGNTYKNQVERHTYWGLRHLSKKTTFINLSQRHVVQLCQTRIESFSFSFSLTVTFHYDLPWVCHINPPSYPQCFDLQTPTPPVEPFVLPTRYIQRHVNGPTKSHSQKMHWIFSWPSTVSPPVHTISQTLDHTSCRVVNLLLLSTWSVWWTRPSLQTHFPLSRVYIGQFLCRTCCIGTVRWLWWGNTWASIPCSRCRHVGVMWFQTYPSPSLLSWGWWPLSFPPFSVGFSIGWGLQPMDLFT